LNSHLIDVLFMQGNRSIVLTTDVDKKKKTFRHVTILGLIMCVCRWLSQISVFLSHRLLEKKRGFLVYSWSLNVNIMYLSPDKNIIHWSLDNGHFLCVSSSHGNRIGKGDRRLSHLISVHRNRWML